MSPFLSSTDAEVLFILKDEFLVVHLGLGVATKPFWEACLTDRRSSHGALGYLS